jgi:hypothetical protein
MVNIGSHSEQIEKDLRRMFKDLGWRCRVDVPLNSSVSVYVGRERVGDVQFGDGVQIWINPRQVRRQPFAFVPSREDA